MAAPPPQREFAMNSRSHYLVIVRRLALVIALVGGVLAFVRVSPVGAVEGPTVTIEAVSHVTATTAMLNGTVNPNGVATTYYFVYEPVSGLPSVTTPPTSVGSGTSAVTVSAEAYGLMLNAEYWVWICATNADNVTSRSGNVAFTASEPTSTSSTTAPDVTTNAATTITSTTAKLNGTVNANGASTTYTYRYGLSEDDMPLSTGFTSVGSSPVDVSATVTGLKPDTTYFFYLFASDGTLDNSGSVQSFKTLTDASQPAGTNPAGPLAGGTPATSKTSADSGTNTASRTNAPSSEKSAQLLPGAKRPRIVIDSRGIIRSLTKPIVVPVKLTCAVATCPGSVQLEKLMGKVRLLASADYRIAKGKTAVVYLPLTPAGRVVLAHVARKPLSEMLIVTVKNGNGAKKRLVVS
ncbi:MAG: hypothetical protein ABSA31_00995 [Acidimicrobiales bacterium]|jgi:hypothetical protein